MSSDPLAGKVAMVCGGSGGIDVASATLGRLAATVAETRSLPGLPAIPRPLAA